MMTQERGRWSAAASDGLVAVHLAPHSLTYQPGETLSGSCRWFVEPPSDVRRVELSVLWRTEGKGDEDFGVHFFQAVSADATREEIASPLAFSTTLPPSPLSYDGPLLKIRWCVRVRVFLKRGKDIVYDKPFQLGRVPRHRAVEPPQCPPEGDLYADE
jgi:hypothetical protein